MFGCAAFPGTNLEERILCQLLGNDGFKLEVGQRQQLDRLLQLLAHYQRLRLADVKAGAESHGHGSSYKAKLSPR